MVHDVDERYDRIRETLDELDEQVNKLDFALSLLKREINTLVGMVREVARDLSEL